MKIRLACVRVFISSQDPIELGFRNICFHVWRNWLCTDPKYGTRIHASICIY